MNGIRNVMFSYVTCLSFKIRMMETMHSLSEDPWVDTAIRHCWTFYYTAAAGVLVFHSHMHAGMLIGGSSTYMLREGDWMPFKNTCFLLRNTRYIHTDKKN